MLFVKEGSLSSDFGRNLTQHKHGVPALVYFEGLNQHALRKRCWKARWWAGCVLPLTQPQALLSATVHSLLMPYPSKQSLGTLAWVPRLVPSVPGFTDLKRLSMKKNTEQKIEVVIYKCSHIILVMITTAAWLHHLGKWRFLYRWFSN